MWNLEIVLSLFIVVNAFLPVPAALFGFFDAKPFRIVWGMVSIITGLMSAYVLWHFGALPEDLLFAINTVVGLTLLLLGPCILWVTFYVPIALSDEELKQRFGYFYVGPPCDGLRAVMKKEGRCFHIDQLTCKPAYREVYDDVGDFYKGEAWVRKGSDEFYIYRNGSRVS